MRFGLFGGPSRGETDDVTAYRSYVEMVQEAEQLGFYGVYLVEHHFTGNGQLSSSLSLLSHLAAKTSTMRLGTAVVVLPWHNPMVVAEQAATVDVLSNGRLDFGVGRGYRDYEFSGFGIDIDEGQERFEEAIEVIRKAWTSPGRFSHHGKRWHFENVVAEPTPVQRPHPPIWTGAGSQGSIEAAAKAGYNLYLDQVGLFDLCAERVGWFRAACEAIGRPYDPSMVALTRSLRLAHTPAEREGLVESQMAALTELAESTRPPEQGGRNLFYSPPEARRETVEGASIIGTPDECIERLKRLEAGGVQQVLFTRTRPQDLALFAREVMPAFA